MNMEFSKTSGSRPELDRGVRIILRYDGETAKGKEKQCPSIFPGRRRRKPFSVSDP
jgi:hypothetical protein